MSGAERDREAREPEANPQNVTRRNVRSATNPEAADCNGETRGPPRRPPPELNEEEEEEIELKYGAQHVIKLFIPVSICMLAVVATISSVNFYTEKGQYLLYTPFHEESPDIGWKLWDAIRNALILLCVVIVLTFVLIFLYMKRCYGVIHAWLILSSSLLLSLFTFFYLFELLRGYNIAADWITLAVGIWNFGVLGMVSIHWHGPLIMQQAYLIFIAALMSLVFIKYLPDITLWVVLGVISIWDLVAVLTPKGPLKMLVETAQERNETIFPALIYSSTFMYSTLNMADNDHTESTSTGSPNRENSSTSEADSQPNPPEQARRPKRSRQSRETENGAANDVEEGFTQDWQTNQEHRAQRRAERVREYAENNPSNTNPQPQPQIEDDEEERGIKLGLGDFIFYSVLVGEASSNGDWNTTIACFIAILIGLCLTLIMLAIFKKALPALPVSIFFGLVFNFSTHYIVVPFTEKLAIEQVFI